MGFLSAGPKPVPVDRTAQDDPNEVNRPSHWNEEVGERTIDPELDFPSNREVEVEEPEGFHPDPPSQPVYLTEPPPGGTSMKDWAPQTATLTTSATQLAGADKRRTRLVVKNIDSTNAVHVGRRREDQGFMAFTLKPDESVDFTHTEQVWAKAATATANLTWFVEYGLEDF